MTSLAGGTRHDRILELAANAIDGPLSAAEGAELEGHLDSCPACARTAAAFRADAAALSLPLDVRPGRRVDDAVAAAIAGPSTRLGRSMLLLAAATLLGLALVGAITAGAYLLREAEEPPTSLEPSPRPVDVASPEPDGSPAVVGESWQSIPFEPATGGLIEAITFNGPDLVGVGHGDCVVDSNGVGECLGAAWAGGPGGSLVQAPAQVGLEMGAGGAVIGPDSGIFDVAAGPAGLVAIGYDLDPPRSACEVAPCTSGPAVWRSTDGRTWERVKLDLGPGVIDRFSEPVAAIAANPQGYVIVGYALRLESSGGAGARAAAWTSPDGLTWTRAPDNEDLFLGPCLADSSPPACGGMREVAWTGSQWVAVGHAFNGTSNRTRPYAWTSPDGLDWTLAIDGMDFDGSLAGVTTGGPGIVAVGSICDPGCSGTNTRSVAAVSPDGSRWSFVPLTGTIALEGVASAGGEVFAFDAVGRGIDVPAELQLWRTDDGLSWRRVSSLPTITDAQSYTGVDIAAQAGRLVIAGSTAIEEDTGSTNFAYLSPPTSSAPTASSPSPNGVDGPIRLARAPANLGCDSLPGAYGSAILRIDPSATEPVWAEAMDTNEFWSRTDGTRLGVLWSDGFEGGTAADPVIRGPDGQVVVRDGDVIDLAGSRASARGLFLCGSSQTDLYILEDPPA